MNVEAKVLSNQQSIDLEILRIVSFGTTIIRYGNTNILISILSFNSKFQI